jgi:hypothetical protein
MIHINADQFEQATGRNPVNDDLERVNCPDAGKQGHNSCGWCFTHNCPVFDCTCEVIRSENGEYKTKVRF